MRATHINSVDLNLLPALIALLDERHVSRAADRVRLSQPAMSRALQRLRRALDDELLVRGRDGYALTPRAERIQRELAAFVPRLDALFAPEQFQPREAAQTFRLAGTDYAVSRFGPELFRRLFAESPHSTLRFETWHDGVFDDVDRGVLDLAFFGASVPAQLRSQRLFTEQFVCVLSADHPLARRRRLTLAEYLDCSHVVVATERGLQPAIDQRLQSLGSPRRASLTVPYHAAAPLAVPGTVLVATVPAGIAEPSADLAVVAAPKEIEPLQYSMTWHPRLNRDPAHVWLRDLVRSVATG